MSASTCFCHVLDGNVSVVSDLEGKVTNVVCPEFFRLSNRCMKKTRDLGFFAGLAARATDVLSGSRAIFCEFTDPEDSPMSKFSNR